MKIFTILSIFLIFSGCKGPEPKVELTEKDLWRIRGKWAVQMENFRRYEDSPVEYEIKQVSYEEHLWRKQSKQ